MCFADIAGLMTALGFSERAVKGSHHVYVHPRVHHPVSLQAVRGQAEPYQLRQLLRTIDEYDLRLRNQ
jgi:predicted RNA binding protein YcfA (HicA-like mRNA interferase family)